MHKGEEKYWIAYSEELVTGDLDSESKRLVQEVIDLNRRYAKELSSLFE